MKIALAALCAASLSLAACATDPTTGLPTVNPAALTVLSGDVQQVQSVATRICGFVPTAETVASIIANLAGAPGVGDIIATVANGICAAVSTRSARRGAAPPMYAGVVIRGTRVRR